MKLTLPQQDIYYEQLIYPNVPIYNIGAKIKIEGDIDIDVFKNAFVQLMDQHDSYRTVFQENQDTLSAKILDSYDGQLEYLDLSSTLNSEEDALAIIEEKYMKTFEIAGGSVLHRFCLIKVSQKFYYFFTVSHHIITDGWATSIMFQRLVKNYNELLEFGEVTSTYPFTYSDFVSDDEEYQHSEDYNNNRNYWVEKFKILPENLFEKIDSYTQLPRSSRKTLTIPRSTYNELNLLAKEYKSSTFHLLLALLYIYFGRKHQNHDFAIGLPVLNRSKSIFKKTVGLFMGVSALRIELDFEKTVQELISSIKNQLRQDYRHQRFPIGKLIQELQIFQEKERLFNITLSYEKQDYANNFGTTKTTVIPLTHNSERVALAIYIREFDSNEDVDIDFDYNLNYFDEVSISKVTSHFENLVHNVLTTPHTELKELTYLSAEEKNQLLTSFNKTTVAYPDTTLLHYFDQQVNQNPNKVAVIDKAEELSYSKLNDISNRIAEYIINFSEGDNTRHIGVLLERSTTTIAILLGILKAGKSYIPLDPTFPITRLKYIIDHSEIKLLISDQELFEIPEITNIKVGDLLTKVQTLSGSISHSVKSTDTAYIIYTSGSTGNPKGVEIGHKALLNFLLSMQDKPGIFQSDTLFAVTTYSFDISILEFFAPLIAGASLYIVDNETLADPRKTIQTLKRTNPTIIQATPSFYQLLFNAGWRGNKGLKVLCGGDLLSEDLASSLLESCGQLWNMYGPTETTIWSSVKQIKTAEEASNIGSPINNTEFYILDSFQKLVPIGSSGSLCIGGDGLAKGYYKAEELTNQKFIPNPFIVDALIYDTSDVARWNSNGEVEFLGRNDNQVKIRGYRIELGDIESKLNNLSEIKQAIVIAKKHNNQDAFLVAYIIKENDSYNEEKCILTLETELPKYMVPYAFVEVEEFPLTPNKKVNRKVLSQREINKSKAGDEFQPPQNELQEKLIGYWKDILHYHGEISISDNFFSLGGHSLNAIKLIHLINTELVFSINLKALFDFPTILSLSNYLSSIEHKETKKIPKCTTKEYYAITPSQYEIWLASQQESRSIAYNMVAAFRIDGNLDSEKITRSVTQLISNHEILRTNFIEINGSVSQKINNLDNTEFQLSIEQSEENKAFDIIEEFINSEFDFERDLLLKMQLIKTSETSAFLVFCTHHIIMDGWSLELLTNDFIKYYNDLGTENHIEKNIQFKDYAEWLADDLVQIKENSFWPNYLEGYQLLESFPSDNLDNADNRGSQIRFEFNKEETLAIKSFLREQTVTMHSFLIAALNILIYKISGHNDIIIGTVNSGRDRLELNNMIGMFVKTLPLRIKVAEDQNVTSILESVQEGVLQLSKNQDIPQEFRKKSFFDVLVAFQNPDFSYQENIQLDKATLTSCPIDVEYSRLPLLFNFFESNDLLNAVLSYDSGKYDAETIELIVLRFRKLISHIISNQSMNIAKLDISLEIEKQNTVDIDFNF